MENQNQIYYLKDGRKVSLIASYQDYFSDEKFLVLKENEKIYIAHANEFSANIAPKSKKVNRTTNEKIDLYRSYFRGNDQMVATSFENSEGKRVYYVWCNQRKKGPCPKIKKSNFQCSLCHSQMFQPLDNQIVFDHLRGFNKKNQEVFYGIYPISNRNTVYFLAFDFDKREWKKEVTALVRSAEKFQLKPLLELSQSGKGCHVWLFFKEEIAAKKARDLGKLLLRHAMLQYPTLSFDSFDRLFPSQDKITETGFGNLIALPLQGSRVKKGCSRFVDKEFHVIDDIWETLEKTPKISDVEVERIIDQIQQEIPVQFYEAQGKEETEISLFEETEEIKVQFEDPITVIVKDELIIQRADVSRKALVQLKFLATFSNQSFYIAQRKRLSTRGIPRIISLAEINEQTIRLPRGLQEKVTELFPNVNYINQRSKGKEVAIHFNGELYEEQKNALNALEKQTMGILCAGTGFGKTVIAAKLIADKKVSTLILVNNKNLAIQWKAQLDQFLTIDDLPFEEYTAKGRKRKKEKIGKIYGGQELRSGLVDIALFQSVTKHPDLENLLSQYGMIIVDEAHHVAAKTFEDVIKKAGSYYLYGLTATPKREDHLENILYMRLGEIAHTAAKEIPKHVDQKLYMRLTALGEHEIRPEQQTLHENYEQIIESNDRNQQIILDISENVKANRHIIVLSRYVKHLDVLKQQLEVAKLDAPIYILNGKMKSKKLREELTNLKEEGNPFVLLTTGSYAGEGFDLAALDTLMLVMPISGKGNLQQYLGRLLRNLDRKSELRVYDYVDYAIPMLYRMYQKRLRTYKKLGYQLCEENQTELSRSNLFVDNYQQILSKDLSAAQEGVWVIPYLSKKVMEQLLSMKLMNQITLILPKKTKNKHVSYEIHQQNINQLLKLGYKIKFKNTLVQHFVILDNLTVWMLPTLDTLKEVITLRVLSRDIAARLSNYFDV